MLEEEGAVIVGLLVGLNVIDANLCVKGEDLDSQVSTVIETTPHKNLATSSTTCMRRCCVRSTFCVIRSHFLLIAHKGGRS